MKALIIIYARPNLKWEKKYFSLLKVTINVCKRIFEVNIFRKLHSNSSELTKKKLFPCEKILPSKYEYIATLYTSTSLKTIFSKIMCNTDLAFRRLIKLVKSNLQFTSLIDTTFPSLRVYFFIIFLALCEQICSSYAFVSSVFSLRLTEL